RDTVTILLVIPNSVSVLLKRKHVWLEFLAIGHQDLSETHMIRAVLGGITGNSDLVPRLKCILVPANPGEQVRTTGFGIPLYDGALVIPHVQMNFHMGIGKLEIRYSPLYGDQFRGVVRCCSVVRKGGGGNDKNTS